jgi:hypothetical protein
VKVASDRELEAAQSVAPAEHLVYSCDISVARERVEAECRVPAKEFPFLVIIPLRKSARHTNQKEHHKHQNLFHHNLSFFVIFPCVSFHA